MISFLKAALAKYFPLIFLVLIVCIISILNYRASSFLIGWDNFLSEFDIPLALKRSLSSVWISYGGTGFLDGMGHASELPHLFIKGLISLIFPLNIVRQVYIFLMLGIGVFGVYFLIKSLIHYENRFLSWAAPTLGALFYLFNLATVQNFYVPFEPFAVHYAFLPWLFLSTLNFIAHRNFKSLLLFFIINFFAVSQAQVPTIFVVYVFSLSVFLLVLILETKKKEILLSSIKVLVFTFIINAFWLLPFLYFLLTNSQVAFLAKINQMSTETVFLQNKEFGNLNDAMLLKGFWFNNVDPNFEGNFDYMLKPWREHLTPPIILIGYIFFIVILIGFIYVKRKKPFVLPFCALFLLSFTMLAVNTPPFSWIDAVLRKIPLFDQVFRFPFTKFSILAALTYSFFFAIGIGKIVSLIEKKIKPNFIFILALLLLIIFIFPIFKGNLFYEKERVNFPPEYIDLFRYFKSKPTTARVADFPQYTFWGWNYYRWGYGGAGFLWSAVPQPILDRTFDVWSKENENYYWEISYALYSKNSLLFKKVLQKYNIEYIVLDKNIQSPFSQKSLFIPEIEEILKESGITKDANFGSVSVYKTPFKTRPSKFISSFVNRYKFGDFDKAYFDLGDYISVDPENANVLYPFRSLFSGKNEEDKEFKVEIKTNSLAFSFGKSKFEVPKLETSFFLKGPVTNCDNFRKEKLYSEVLGDTLKLGSKNATACVSMNININPPQGYLLTVNNKNIKGRSLHLWIQNGIGGNNILDTYLSKNKDWTTSYFVIPPQDRFSKTFSIHFDNVSIEDETINEIGKISIYPIPYDVLVSQRIIKNSPNPVWVLTSNQAYNEGWKAYLANNEFLPFLFGTELKSHVLVNNWENGWILDDNTLKKSERIIIVYLPQYLEYIGFIILFLFFAGLIFNRFFAKIKSLLPQTAK